MDFTQAGILNQRKTVLQSKRYAFKHGTRQVTTTVAQSQANERAARQRVGMRRAFPGKIWQELQTFTSCWNRFQIPSTTHQNSYSARGHHGTIANFLRLKALRP